MGRPSKFKPEIAQKIIDSLRSGNYFETACALARIDERTVRRWVADGESGKKPFVDFALDVRGARAAAVSTAVAGVRRAGHGTPVTCPDCGKIVGTIEPDHRALEWWLEHADPDRWGNRIEVKVQMRIEETMRDFLERCKQALPDDIYERLLLVAAGQTCARTATGEKRPSGGVQ